MFSEFLPLLVGPEAMKKYRLRLTSRQDFRNYNKYVRPNIRNGFSTAAFRFGHTLLPSKLKMKFNDQTEKLVDLHTKFFKPFDLFNESNVGGVSPSCIFIS